MAFLEEGVETLCVDSSDTAGGVADRQMGIFIQLRVVTRCGVAERNGGGGLDELVGFWAVKVSNCARFLYEWQPEAAISVLARHGYSAAELSTEHAQMLLDRGDAATEGLKFKKHCDALGFDIHQGHFYLYINLAVKEEAEKIKVFDNMKRWCDLFNAIGIKAGVVHGCKGPMEDGSRERSAAMLEALLQSMHGEFQRQQLYRGARQDENRKLLLHNVSSWTSDRQIPSR